MPDSVERPTATITRHDAVAVITIDRPAVKNAIDLPTAELIAGFVDRLDDDRDVRAVVLTGAGGTFCAGMDLKATDRPVVAGRGFAGIVERPPRQPLIAAVEGYALGGGCELTLAADLVVAGAGAQFGLPEVRRGLTAAAGGLFRLGRRVPLNVAAELLFTGATIVSQRAYEIGLVNRVVPDGGALDAALELATAIAANGPLAVQTSKQVLQASLGWDPAEGFERQAELVDAVRRSEDAGEGRAAFVERRAPVWSGR